MPLSLRAALEGQITDKMTIPALVAAADSVSRRYRRDTGGGNVQIRSREEAMAYVLARMPATYAAVTRVLTELQRVLPDFAPRNVLDMGAGPGTATLAVSQTYDLMSYYLVEPNPYLRGIGQDMVAPFWGIPSQTEWLPSRVEDVVLRKDAQFDLVVASYVFNEVPEHSVVRHVESLWSSCAGVLVLLEPGTPQGAGVIGRIRSAAMSWEGAHILAPCPHADQCPLHENDSAWCHFSVRTSRTKLHKTLKGGDAGFEDEKFSYIILSRVPAASRPAYRLIGHPSGTKLRELQVCGPNGAETLQVSKSHPLHKRSKKLEWGDGCDV